MRVELCFFCLEEFISRAFDYSLATHQFIGQLTKDTPPPPPPFAPASKACAFSSDRELTRECECVCVLYQHIGIRLPLPASSKLAEKPLSQSLRPAIYFTDSWPVLVAATAAATTADHLMHFALLLCPRQTFRGVWRLCKLSCCCFCCSNALSFVQSASSSFLLRVALKAWCHGRRVHSRAKWPLVN